MNRSQIESLRTRLARPESLLTGVAILEKYHQDATPFRTVPDALLLAESVEDIATAVVFCRDEGIPITPRGAGTGLSGGCIASPGGLLLSIERLRDLRILPEERLAICEPGVITKEVQDAAAAHGLTYPPDPASYEESTLGGNIAENAGGLRCKRYGVTRDYVVGLEVVLAGGSLLRTGIFNQCRGFSLGEVMVGSEGTLGLVTRIALRLVPQPGQGATILVSFGDPADAAEAVAEINTSGLVPTVMEFMDGDAVACSTEYEPREELKGAAALLLLETSDRDSEHQAADLKAICARHRCLHFSMETGSEQADRLWRVRRNLSKAVKAAAGLRISEDVAVTNSRFPRLVEFVAEMNRRSRLRINGYGHAGDGNLHVNFMADADTPENRTEIDRWVQVLMRKTVELGGTLTGEHGIGLAKKAYLTLEFDQPTLGLMRQIKSTFDPGALFNPDKLFPTL